MSAIDTSSTRSTEAETASELSLLELVDKLKELYRYLLRKKSQLIVFTVIGAVLGVGTAVMWPETYTAKLTFAQEESKTPGGGLSGLANQFGIDIGSMLGGTNMFSGDNILGLLASPTMVKKIMLTPWDEKGTITLADKYAELGKYKKKWQKKWGVEFSFKQTADGRQKTLRHDSLLNVLVATVIEKDMSVGRRDKKISFVDVSATFKDEWLAVAFVNRLAYETAEFYAETKTRRLRQNVDRLQARADSISRLLNRQSYNAAAAQSQILDVNPAYQVTAVDAEIVNRNKFMLATIFGEVTKQLEAQKVILTQETPVMQVVDPADLPLKKNRKSKVLFLLSGSLIAFLLTASLLSLIWMFRQK